MEKNVLFIYVDSVFTIGKCFEFNRYFGIK